MIEFLIVLGVLFGFSFAISCLSYALEVWTSPGHIFQFWGYFIGRNESKWWSKPLGGCIICQNTWLEIIGFGIMLTITNEWQHWYLLLFAPVVGNAWLRVVLK